MNNLPNFNPRSDAPKKHDEPGEGDDIPCEKCGAVALDTGLECSECGHDNYKAVYGKPFGPAMTKPETVLTEVHKDHIIGLTRMHCGDRIADALMREFAKLSEKSEHCMCAACKNGVIHASDCSVHNGPAMQIGPCDCGVTKPIGYVRQYALEHLSKPGQTVINHVPQAEEDIALYTRPPTDAALLEAAEKAEKALRAALPYMQCDKHGAGPDCTEIFQAIFDISAAIKAHKGEA